MNASTVHKLYWTAFQHCREQARLLGVSLRNFVKTQTGYSGKVLRRGTPGAFGYNLRPSRSAKTDRRGYNAPGNSRNRRFARRHPQHFCSVPITEARA